MTIACRPQLTAIILALLACGDVRRRCAAQKLDALLAEQWEYTLQRSPEMASQLGDGRYNDKWRDRSFEAIEADRAADGSRSRLATATRRHILTFAHALGGARS